MAKTVSIGICAFNEARRIPALLDSLLDQALSPDFVVTEILVVASGCTDGTDRIVEERAESEARLILIREPERRGKASAINEILDAYQGEILVLVNADARLVPGSLFALLQAFGGKDEVELACGLPSPDPSSNPILDIVESVWWRIHNRTLQALSDLGSGNHCCDEFMAMKRGFVDSIPPDVVNDGAYFGVNAAVRGIGVRFCPGAVVLIETPSSLSGLLRQRRRILGGHHQVASLLGRSPYTLERLISTQPALAVRILAAELSDRPLRTLLFFGIAGPLELISHLLSSWDRARNPGYQPAWPTVE